MARTVSIGNQDFEKIRINNYFYVDKTNFISQWWESADEVTLITRPRRFGKTLNMSMLEKFFSVEYAGRGELFEGLFIWEEKSLGRDEAHSGQISGLVPHNVSQLCQRERNFLYGCQKENMPDYCKII